MGLIKKHDITDNQALVKYSSLLPYHAFLVNWQSPKSPI